MLYIIRNKGKYLEQAKQYIENTLQEIEEKYIYDTNLSEYILEKTFHQYTFAYDDALHGKFDFDHNFTKVKCNTIYREDIEREFLSSVVR